MSARPPDQTTDRAGNQPLVWHYGLMAERWGEFLHETPELPFLLAQVERFGQPVLDLEKRRDGELISEEQYALRGGAYMKPEVLLMLHVAGFRAEDIATRGDYRDEPATADSEKVVFIARRAAA